MVALVQLTEPEFEKWRESAVREYAAELVRAGNDDEAHSIENAEGQLRSLLPYGPMTNGHYIYSVVDERDGKPVGIIWYGEAPPRNDTIFIYDIHIDELFRGQGYGTAVLRLVEEKARGLGKERIGLQVFGHNERAQKLYRELGYRPINIIMAKEL